MTLRVLVVLLLATGASPLVSPTAHAQGPYTGTIRGAIVDPQGRPVAGAVITITSVALQRPRSDTSAIDGSYAVPLLPPGEYRLHVAMTGFEPIQISGTLPLGGTVEHDLSLRAAAVAADIVVRGSPAPLATPSAGLNLPKREVDVMPIGRTLSAVATMAPGVVEGPASNQLVISGGVASDNIFLLNGVDVNDNKFGNPQSLFIEDAIEETQVLSSGIPAEFGRFTGGAVVALTKSGGNSFSGSLRLTLTSAAWTDETPFEDTNDVTREGPVNRTYEGTLGGPIVTDGLWFFGAFRQANVSSAQTFPLSGIPFTVEDHGGRGEVKLTGAVAAGHTIQGGYLNNARTVRNQPSFRGLSIDPATLTDERQPNSYLFGNYRAVVRDNLLMEVLLSRRRFAFEGGGGTSTNLVDSPIFTTSFDAHYNAPYFDATDPEQRNNNQLTGSVLYAATGAGRHDIKGGFERFRSQSIGGNSQSSTGWVFIADYILDNDEGRPFPDSQGRPMPIFLLNQAFAEQWLPQRGATLNVDTWSLYAQDQWTLNRHVSANLGVRYERAHSEATGGIVGVDTGTLVPRLALSYDLDGDGRVVFHTTYGHYAGRYNDAQINANSTVGNPDRLDAVYIGPSGLGRSFLPGFDPNEYVIVGGALATENVLFDRDLSTPVTKEFTVSGGGTIGRAGYAHATYVWRHTSGFIDDFIEEGNGYTDAFRDGDFVGQFTNRIYRNTDLARRSYQAAVFQGRIRPLRDLVVQGSWTVQLRNHGNYEEVAESPGAPTVIGDYPEAFSPARHYPDGRLPGFLRHRARLWAMHTLDAGAAGRLSVTGLWRIQSGRTYSTVTNFVPLSPTQDALLQSYIDPPFFQTLYFGERGSGTFPGAAILDLSLNYDVPVFRSLRPWLKMDIINVLNNDTLIGFNTTVRPDFSGPIDTFGLPTAFIESPNFGRARSTTDFPQARTVQMAFGIRF